MEPAARQQLTCPKAGPKSHPNKKEIISDYQRTEGSDSVTGGVGGIEKPGKGSG